MCQALTEMLEDSRQEGEMRLLISQIQKKCHKGKGLSTIAEELEETEAAIQPFYILIQKYPQKDTESIYKEFIDKN